MRQVWGLVLRVDETTADYQHLHVSYIDRNGYPDEGPALCYPMLSGICAVGEGVLLNTTAVDLELGTGGVHFVISRLPADAIEDLVKHAVSCGDDNLIPVNDGIVEGGHIMKLRYTPLQRDVVTFEDPASPYHAIIENARSLEGTPVVCCGLHSQVPLVAAAVKHVDPLARIVYCMTDQASLMLGFSRVVRSCRESGLLDATITCGQALGGEAETITLHSGLLAAYHIMKADVIISGIGPGVVGSGTAFGHGGVAQGEALNAVVSLYGAPIAPLRLSFADKRERHLGVSHHSICALSSITLASVTVPIPEDLTSEQRSRVEAELEETGIYDRHDLIAVEVHPEQIDLRGITITTMRRTIEDDPAFFSAAFAAGIAAGELSKERR